MGLESVSASEDVIGDLNIVERSLLKYNLVRFASCLAPASVLNGGTVHEHNFGGLVEVTLHETFQLHLQLGRKCNAYTFWRLAQTGITRSFQNFGDINQQIR